MAGADSHKTVLKGAVQHAKHRVRCKLASQRLGQLSGRASALKNAVSAPEPYARPSLRQCCPRVARLPILLSA